MTYYLKFDLTNMHHLRFIHTKQKRNLLLPPATKLGQGYVFTRVCDSVHREGVSASVYAGIPPPPRTGTPLTRHPPGSDPPPPIPSEQSMLGCILVLTLSLPYVNIGFNPLCTHLEAMPISLSRKCKRTLSTNWNFLSPYSLHLKISIWMRLDNCIIFLSLDQLV